MGRYISYGSTPVSGTVVLNDFAPWRAAQLGEYRISCDKPGINGETPTHHLLS